MASRDLPPFPFREDCFFVPFGYHTGSSGRRPEATSSDLGGCMNGKFAGWSLVAVMIVGAGSARVAAAQMPDDPIHVKPRATPVAKDAKKKTIRPIKQVPAGKIAAGTKLYLMTDKRYIGEVLEWQESHRFPDGKTMEGVRVKLEAGDETWLPADTARRIYRTL